MSQLEQSLKIEVVGDRLQAVADPDYAALNGMLGGWTAALLLKASLRDVDQEQSPAALTVNFMGRVTPGEKLLIRLARLGGTRSVSHCRADLYGADGEEVLASASLVMAARRPSDSAIDPKFPEAPPPDQLTRTNPPGVFGSRTDTCPVHGIPPFNRADMRSLAWVRENTGRPVDHIQLAYLSDIYAPRAFHISAAPRPSSTLTICTYFVAAPEELAAVGDDYVLTEAEGTRIECSLAASQARLWSRAGTLLATTEQLAFFK